MDSLGETSVCSIVLYAILLKVDLRYTDGICLVLSAWWMSEADSQPSQANSNVKWRRNYESECGHILFITFLLETRVQGTEMDKCYL